MTFRKAETKDINSICSIYDAILAKEEAGQCSTGWKRGVYPTEATVIAALKRGDIYVEEVRGTVVGSAIFNTNQVDCYANAPWKHSCKDNEAWVMHTLVIDPRISGKGYGRAFLDFYEQTARQNGFTELRIDTQLKNKAARTMYGHYGFEEIAVVPCVFNGIPNVQLVLLEKNLSK